MLAIPINPEQLEAELRFWQYVLRLRDWIITVEISADLDDGDLGETFYDGAERRAAIRLCPFMKGQEIRETNPLGRDYNMQEVLVHELLHLVLADVATEDNMQWIERVIDTIAPLLASARYWFDTQDRKSTRLNSSH